MSGKHKYSPRKTGTIIDSVHIVISAAVTIMALFAIFDPSRFMFLFPLIFALAALLFGVTGWYNMTAYQRNSQRKAAGIAYIIVAIVLAVLFAVSAVYIWGHN